MPVLYVSYDYIRINLVVLSHTEALLAIKSGTHYHLGLEVNAALIHNHCKHGVILTMASRLYSVKQKGFH